MAEQEEIILPSNEDEEGYCPSGMIRSAIRVIYTSNKERYKLSVVSVNESSEKKVIDIDYNLLLTDVLKYFWDLDIMLSDSRILSNFDILDDNIAIIKDWVHQDRPIRVYFDNKAISQIYGTFAEMFVMTKQLGVPVESYASGLHQYYFTLEPEYEGFLTAIGADIEYNPYR
jgi:hypothetical protein